VTSTADIVDEHGDRAAVCEIDLPAFGGVRAFSGAIATLRCNEDNVLLRECISELGNGRVLVVDGGGSRRVALLGDNLAGIALDSGWAGVVVNGCVRDVRALRELAIGIRALGSNPRRSDKVGGGEVGVAVSFGGVTFAPGDLLHADDDGIVVVPAGLSHA
jgi:regulator of ribonuclease activity A